MIRFPESVVTGTVDGELVLLDCDTGRYFGLNRTATRMVELLRVDGSEESVVTALTREYNAPPQRIRTDLQTLVSSLTERGLAVETPL